MTLELLLQRNSSTQQKLENGGQRPVILGLKLACVLITFISSLAEFEATRFCLPHCQIESPNIDAR